MWPPNSEDVCNYSYVEHEHAALNPHDHYHHHHDFPHSSVHHVECFQTLSCPSDLPVESSYYHQMPPTYQDLGHTDSSPPFWCPEVDCAHERCSSKKDIPHEQNKIFEEISKECEHLLKQSDCEKCSVLHTGEDNGIAMKDLVDIVMQTVEHNIQQSDQGETKILSRKREQNKVAAARYRDKQKAKWQDLLNMRTAEEERNVTLKGQVSKLEEEVAAMRQKVLGAVRK